MKRREFIAGLGGAAAWPVVARSQQNRKVPVVGVLWHAGNEQQEANYLGALRKGLVDLGYVEGKNILLENRFAAENYDRFDAMARELAGLKVDVIVAVTRAAALAAQRATSTIPVVFIIDPDPVASKLVSSFAHPGANITGLTAVAGDLSDKRLEILADAIPGLTRIALLLNARSTLKASYIEKTRGAAAARGILQVKSIEVGSPSDLAEAFSTIADEGFGGVSVPGDAMLYNERRLIAELALRNRLPSAFDLREHVEAGGLLSYGATFRTAFYRLATYVDKVVKGEKPADIPVERPTKLELVVNLKTANALGLVISEAFLLRADEVIE
jgi:putative tryptophan/tyrosine transport system substrate-binding protein